MFVELHIIQNFAPSCLNRDDTNAPKDCIFGGFRRARISSQCIKRAIRTHCLFEETIGEAIGMRTRQLIEKLVERLTQEDIDPDQARSIAQNVVKVIFSKLDSEGHTKVAIYIDNSEIEWIVEQIKKYWDQLPQEQTEAAEETAGSGSRRRRRGASGGHEALNTIKNEFKAFTTNTGKSPDIALFGRMIADDAHLNVDAACQVAHAISTHKVSMEMDFFTAVDDLQPQGETGAAMMGIVEFNSACFYRYANINTIQLLENLKNDTELMRNTVKAFLRAAVWAIPTGKQNSMAAQNLPSFVLAVVRKNGFPASLANAFEVPISVSERNPGLVAQSVKRLVEYWDKLQQAYGQNGLKAHAFFSLEQLPEGFGSLGQPKENLDQVIQCILPALEEGSPENCNDEITDSYPPSA